MIIFVTVVGNVLKSTPSKNVHLTEDYNFELFSDIITSVLIKQKKMFRSTKKAFWK